MNEELLALLPAYLGGHLRLSLLALLCGVLVSLPLGVFVARRSRLEAAVLGVAAVLQTIPSLALLALMVPLLALVSGGLERGFGVTLSSIGFLPAWIALTLYSVLPILRNTVTGLAQLDPAIVEAARGVGMTDRQRLWRVELPLALPVIVAGLRTATVWVVGSATLATPVGATSLGNYIFSGLQTRNAEAVVLGSLLSCALAMGLDFLVRQLELGLQERKRTRAGLALGALAALTIYALASLVAANSLAGGSASTAQGKRPIVVGSKSFTEQYVLAALIVDVLEHETDSTTREVPSLGSTVAFDALREDEIDIYVDYSGTIWSTILQEPSEGQQREALLADVVRRLESEYGIVVAAALGFENTYAIAMREDRAAALGIARLGDLARHAPALRMGGDYEFFARAEWRALEAKYGLAFAEERSMDPALMYEAVSQGAVDAISAFSTDGRIASYGLRVLEDEAGVIPPYDAIVLVGPRTARERPQVVAALRGLAGKIRASDMQQLNRAVDEAGRQPAVVAREFARTLR